MKSLFIALAIFLCCPVLTHAQTASEIFHGPRTNKRIALTFDADMNPKMKRALEVGSVKSWYNHDVIDVLHQTHTPATLFLTGMWTEIYAKEATQLAHDSLFEIGNHSYSHPAFYGRCYGLEHIRDDQKEYEVTHAQEVIQHITGVTPHYFRFPGGCSGPKERSLVAAHHLKMVKWDVVSGDAFNNNEQKIEQKILRNAQNGSIVVLHLNGGPNAPKTAVAIAKVIPELKKVGYTFVTVSQLFK